MMDTRYLPASSPLALGIRYSPLAIFVEPLVPCPSRGQNSMTPSATGLSSYVTVPETSCSPGPEPQPVSKKAAAHEAMRTIETKNTRISGPPGPFIGEPDPKEDRAGHHRFLAVCK